MLGLALQGWAEVLNCRPVVYLVLYISSSTVPHRHASLLSARNNKILAERCSQSMYIIQAKHVTCHTSCSCGALMRQVLEALIS